MRADHFPALNLGMHKNDKEAQRLYLMYQGRAQALHNALTSAAKIYAWAWRTNREWLDDPTESPRWSRIQEIIKQKQGIPSGVALLLAEHIDGCWLVSDGLHNSPLECRKFKSYASQVASGTMRPDVFSDMFWRYEEIIEFDWLWVFSGSPAYYYGCGKEPKGYDFDKEIEKLKAFASRNRQGNKSCLYLMKNKRSGHYKIGVSKQPKFREKTLQSQEPDVELVGCWPKMAEWEKHWHSHFSKNRLRGEWFSLTPAQTRLFCHTCTKGEGPPMMAV